MGESDIVPFNNRVADLSQVVSGPAISDGGEVGRREKGEKRREKGEGRRWKGEGRREKGEGRGEKGEEGRRFFEGEYTNQVAPLSCTNLCCDNTPKHRRIAFAGLEISAAVAPSAPVAGNQAAGQADINAKRWSDSHIVQAIINVARVVAISKGLFSMFALAVVAPLAQLPMRDENSVFRVDMYFGVIGVGCILSFSGLMCGIILACSLPEGVHFKSICCTLMMAMLCSVGTA